ncbi:hypothetical protein VTK73DRAFT_1362 [Phialemonium thermophilum]|uniref:Methyltransferase type 11 domain-containing protein n=1 Tax=Phialemonium thermophilum TaxID=223376 RepID=A0ABR3XAJ0_9PEZI
MPGSVPFKAVFQEIFPVPQNIYDKPQFLDGYSKLQRSLHGLDSAPSGHDCGLSSRICTIAGFSTSAARFQGVTYQRADLAALQFPADEAASYDMVYSSLTFHYLKHLPELVVGVARALKSGGQFCVLSRASITTATSDPKFWGGGPVNEEMGRRYWPLYDY